MQQSGLQQAFILAICWALQPFLKVDREKFVERSEKYYEF